jgi:hypothetical protein
MECRLPSDKIQKTNNLLYKVQHKKKISLRKLQSLIGLLNFACLVVCPGRAFLRRLIDHTKKVSRFIWLWGDHKKEIIYNMGHTSSFVLKLHNPLQDTRKWFKDLTWTASAHGYTAIIIIFPKIEISIKDEKTVLPTTVITIYGIEVDSIQMECRLPLDKIQKINNLLYKVQHKKKISLRKLQSFIVIWYSFK